MKKFKIGLPVAVCYLLTVLFITSFSLVMTDKEEGIFQVKKNIRSYQQIATAVFNQTENNSVIIAERMDKVFFPKRSVIYKLNNPVDYLSLKRLIENNYPVYYFNFTRNAAELALFNQKYFNNYQLSVEESLINFSEQSLYPVKITK